MPEPKPSAAAPEGPPLHQVRLAQQLPTAETQTPDPSARVAPQGTVQDADLRLMKQRAEDERAVLELKVKSATQFMYFTAFIGLAVIILFCIMQFFGRMSETFPKYFVVLIVILASIMLLVMGYTEQQIAPAFGILGTILGYIFGRSDATQRQQPAAAQTEQSAATQQQQPATQTDVSQDEK